MNTALRSLPIHSALLAAMVGLSCAASAVAAPTQWPPVMQPATQEHHPGKVVFLELVTPDLDIAKRFYGQLFGWTFNDMQADGFSYSQALLDGEPVAGLVRKTMPPGRQLQPAWMSFISGDVDAAAKAALAHGGKILFPPHSVPGRGREAVVADPQGAVFAVLDSSSGDPADELPSPGQWIWSSLITADPDNDAAFYQALFDYEVFEMPSQGGTEHLLLASGDYARASANSLPAQRPNARAHWLNYVRVEDVDKAAARVAALGGRVLVEPRIDRHGGKVSVVADPSGAAFGVLQWPDEPGSEVPQ